MPVKFVFAGFVGADGDEALDPLDPLDPQLALTRLINATARKFFVMDATFIQSSSRGSAAGSGAVVTEIFPRTFGGKSLSCQADRRPED